MAEQVTYKVVKGDTLTKIAKKFNTTVSNIAALNNIKNVNLIYVGQVLVISGKSITPENTATTVANGNFVTIDTFGLQADTDNLLFATWSWYGQNTDRYTVEWSYYTRNGVWFTGSSSDTTLTESTYNMPNNAIRVRCRVKPISKKWKDEKGNEHDHWIGVWCDYKEYVVADSKPKVPPVPTINVDQYTLNIRNDNLDINASSIEYEVVQNDAWLYAVGIATITTNSASYKVTLDPGWPYKVRARGRRGDICGDWSDYTSNVTTLPGSNCVIQELYALSDTSVKISWDKVNAAETYSVQYAEKEIYFEGSNGTTTIDNIETTSYIITGLKTGTRYYFRFKANNSAGSSVWSESKSVVLGKKPEPPTTWSDRTVTVAGEKVLLSWLHNSIDGSEQTMSEIEFEVNGVTDTHQIGMDINGKPINTFELPTFMFKDGDKIYWRVRTKGVVPTFSDWSAKRMISVYAPPSLSLNILDVNDRPISTISSFPFYIKGISGSSAQTPIAYVTTVKARQAYVTDTPFGKVEVKEGDEIFSEVTTTSSNLNIKMHAGNIDLENGVEYEVKCILTTNVGLSAEATRIFRVGWEEVKYTPKAEIIIDKERLSVNIKPYCERYETAYMIVERKGNKYIETTNELPNGFVSADSVNNAITVNGRQVYVDEHDRLFCVIEAGKTIRVTNVTMSVYRKTYDGKYVLVSDNINGSSNTFVTDPHPSLDFTRYRIVASDNNTGSISYSDISPEIIGEKSIVIQWNESWSDFITDGYSIQDTNYVAGSMIKLPYNIKISESNSPDISTVNYIGREHPVSYYGTNLGVSSTWNTEIDKQDIELLYAIRRLSMYMGDVYVREPSGVGYWATIQVSYNSSYDSLVIPITINVTRVEGGV